MHLSTNLCMYDTCAYLIRMYVCDKQLTSNINAVGLGIQFPTCTAYIIYIPTCSTYLLPYLTWDFICVGKHHREGAYSDLLTHLRCRLPTSNFKPRVCLEHPLQIRITFVSPLTLVSSSTSPLPFLFLSSVSSILYYTILTYCHAHSHTSYIFMTRIPWLRLLPIHRDTLRVFSGCRLPRRRDQQRVSSRLG